MAGSGFCMQKSFFKKLSYFLYKNKKKNGGKVNMSIKFFYQIADVVTMVALAALIICLIIVVAQKKGQESKYDRKIKAAAAYIAVFFVILVGAALIMTSAGYSALKNRVKEACPGAHSFHSIEKDCVSFIDGDGNKCFFEYDQDKNEIVLYQKSNAKIKKAL